MACCRFQPLVPNMEALLKKSKYYLGDTVEIGFNSAYLLDITRQIEGDTAQVSLADGNSPTILREMDDASALYVIMPMRV